MAVIKMNIVEIRKANLKLLIENEFNGSPSELARAMGLSTANSIYRFFNNGPTGRDIGNSSAANIEKAAGKDKGWLDVPRGLNYFNEEKMKASINMTLMFLKQTKKTNLNSIEISTLSEMILKMYSNDNNITILTEDENKKAM